MDPTELLTVGEVAERLRVTDVTVRRWIQRRELSAINLGGAKRPDYRIYRATLEQFLARRLVGPVRSGLPDSAEDVSWHRPDSDPEDPKVAA
jgi:excisionase family DNA binding protein